jgi:hypothetical protein
MRRKWWGEEGARKGWGGEGARKGWGEEGARKGWGEEGARKGHQMIWRKGWVRAPRDTGEGGGTSMHGAKRVSAPRPAMDNDAASRGPKGVGGGRTAGGDGPSLRRRDKQGWATGYGSRRERRARGGHARTRKQRHRCQGKSRTRTWARQTEQPEPAQPVTSTRPVPAPGGSAGIAASAALGPGWVA